MLDGGYWMENRRGRLIHSLFASVDVVGMVYFIKLRRVVAEVRDGKKP
jgi:hypothetical protein